MIRARAWCRVDLAGGTLDIWPLGLLHRGARTVNVAIDLPVEVGIARHGALYRVRQGEGLAEGRTPEELATHPEGGLVGVIAEALDLPPVEVRLASGSPRGAGLGASSAMAMALLAAGERLLGRPASPPAALAALARDLEARLMGLPTGLQDHYAAALGGALEVLHRPGGEIVRRLPVDLAQLGTALLVVYTGTSHFSAANNWAVIRRRLEGDPEVVGLLSGISEVAAELSAALEENALPRVGELMGREWSLRCHLAEEVSTPTIDLLLRIATSLGAWGGKTCGAGGGGCVAILCPPERREEIAHALTLAGGEILPARPTNRPLEVSG